MTLQAIGLTPGATIGWIVSFDGDYVNEWVTEQPFDTDWHRETIEAWLSANCAGDHDILPNGVIFQLEDDALLCYMTWR